MQNDYSTPDRYSEPGSGRAPQAASSAGLPTETLAAPPVAHEGGAAYIADRNDALGLLLVAIGILALVGQFMPSRDELTGGLVLLTIGSCFLFFSFWKRIYGLLIPGCILAGLSLGVPFADLTEGVSVLWGLAMGFLAILFIGRALFHMTNQWPIYPAIPLFAVGVIVAVSTLPDFLVLSLIWLPLLLIGLGLYLGWGRKGPI